MTADPTDPHPPGSDSSEAIESTWLDGSIPDEVVRQSMDAVVLTDLAFEIRVWNPAAERLYGVDASAAVGQRLRKVVVPLELGGEPIDGTAVLAELETVGSWRRRIIHRVVVGPLAGQDMIVDAQISLLRGSGGRPIGILGVNRDVTDSAKLEAELTALGSLVAATGRARTKSEVAHAALDILCRATGADAGLVGSTDGIYEPTAQLGIQPATVALIFDFGKMGSRIEVALQSADAYVSSDVATAPLRDEVRAAFLADGIRHLIVVGLRLSGRLIGILALGWRQASPREPSRTIMRQAAALIASSLENARLLGAVESGLTEERILTRRMRALVELTRLPDAVGQGISSLDRLIADVDEIIGSDGTSLVWVVGDHFVLAGTHDVDPEWARPLLDRPISSLTLVSRLVEGAQSLLVPLDTDHVSASAARATRSQGYRTLAAFAIREGTSLVGILIAVFRRPVDELEIDERSLDAIGRVLDISFTNRRLREVVSASEQRYRELFESAPDALLVQSLDEVIVDANPAALRLYGDGLIGRMVSDIAVSMSPTPSGDAPGQVTSSTGIGRRLDGSTFPQEIELRTIEIDGQSRVMAIVRDLTERTKLQAELIQAQKMEAIGLLVAGVAHELNNPLAAIVAFSQLIRTDPGLPADLRTQAELLVQEANRTRVIVQNLLDFARQRPPERVETDLRPLVDSILGLQSYGLHRNHLSVEVDIPTDLPSILVDRSQLQQVLINLTVNSAQAILAVGRPGSIRIEARPSSDATGPTVRISIADDGPGIPAEIVDRLFMPFVTTKEPGAGTGLGLSVSYGIIASHGGTLSHKPSLGGGATFVIELPVGREDRGVERAPDAGLTRRAPKARAASPGAQRSAARASRPGRATVAAALVAPGAPPPPAAETDRRSAAPAPVADGAAAGASRRPIRVLVLDDEPSIRDFLGRVLARSGYEPTLAGTGAAALETVRSDPPDAILCDHRMAGMSGTEFHAAVSAIDANLAHRFAFMSGDVLNPELRDFALAHGVQLLAKPFDIAVVGLLVASLVATAPA